MAKKQPEWLTAISVATSAGVTLFCCIALGVFFGNWLDNYLNTYPWCMMGGGLLGSFSGLYSIYKRITG